MDLQQLRSFVAAARQGSVSGAARARGLSQPSLSQQIQRLEEALGVRLFDRVARGVLLTDAGRALLPRAERILSEVEAASGLVADVEAGVGRFAVGAIPTMAPFLLPGVLSGLRAEFPRSALEVREDLTEVLVEQVAEGALDAAIMSTPVDHPRVELVVVGVERLVVVGPAAGWNPSAGGVGIGDLREWPRVSLSEMHCLGQQVAGFCARRGVGAGHVKCHATQLSTLMEMVAMGMGISLVPEMAWRADTDPRRRYGLLTGGGAKREIAIATRRGASSRVMVERLVELVRGAVRGD